MLDQDHREPHPGLPLSVVGRLAPSPTGVLHVGNARSLLAAWLSARLAGGRVLLRVEDLLPGHPDHVASVLADLDWLGLDWDDPGAVVGRTNAADFGAAFVARPALVLQSERAQVFTTVVQRLLARGAAYACVCTRSDIEAALRAPHREDHAAVYPGTCRDRFADLGAALRWEAASSARLGRTPTGAAVRLRVGPGRVTVVDRLRFAHDVDVAGESGDFVIARKDGVAAYMLAVCVDDAAMAVSEVVRGDDLLEVTGQQLLVQRALQAHCDGVALGGVSDRVPTPSYLHLPLVVGDDGRRLAKRNHSLHVRALAAAGIRPGLLRRYLVASLGLGDDAAQAAEVGLHQALPRCRGPLERALPRQALVFAAPELAALAAGTQPPMRWAPTQSSQ